MTMPRPDRPRPVERQWPKPRIAAATGRRLRLASGEVVTHGLKRRVLQDLYYYCMTVSWPLLLASWALAFLAFNVLFSLLYYAAPDSVANVNPPGYLGAFFFSVETLATVGYGDMHPASVYGHILATLEIFLGITNFAVVAGLIFARFSRPTARFLFANVAVVRPLDGRRVLMFRAANARQNIIMEATAKLRMVRDTVSAEGYKLRKIDDLPLLRNEHPLFQLGWNLMHPIDDASPLANETPETLGHSDVMFFLTLSGTDETTGQILMARHAYVAADIRWGHTFRDIISTGPDGIDHFDYDKFHDVDPLYPEEVAN